MPADKRGARGWSGLLIPGGGLALMALIGSGFGAGPPAHAAGAASGAGGFTRLEKSRDEWRRLLPPDRYHILFEEGTERAGSSPLDHEKRPGTFLCAACFLPLFDAAAKFDSGTGWPSFWAPIEGAVGTSVDRTLFVPRTEVHCSRCGGHLGHAFEDGPPPTGIRYCMNGLAMTFEPAG